MNETLILYTTAGIGHKKAALAVKEAFDEKGQAAILKDALDYTNKFFKFSYNGIYLSLVKYVPVLWGFFYYVLDNPFVFALLRPVRRLLNHINSKRLVKFLLDTKPRSVIVTHFLPSEVIADLKKRGALETRLITVITDYKSHTIWHSKYVDCYVVGSEYTKDDLIKRGVSPDRIKVFGIPCAKAFSEERDTARLRSKIGLDPRKKTIFILGGGFGVGPIKNIVLCLDKLERDFQGIVVCGYNKKLKKAVSEIVQSAGHTFKVYGFVDNIDELMAASDALISKSGGITVTEALNAALPMIVVNPIPGQEKRNYDFLKKNNIAVKIGNPREIVGVLEELLSSNRLETLKENLKKLRHTDSGERIADEANK